MTAEKTRQKLPEIAELALRSLIPDPEQPRKEFPAESIERLAKSLLSDGQLVPLLVVLDGKSFIVLDGERRFRAAQLANMPSLRAMVLPARPERESLLLLQLTVNCQREDLTPLEKLNAYQDLMHRLNCNATELAQKLNVSKATVTRILALGKLNSNEQKLVADGQLSSADAYTLSRLDGDDRSKAILEIASGTSTREKLQRRVSRKRETSGPKRKRVVFKFGECVASIASNSGMTLDQLLAWMSDMLMEGKRAKKQGLDILTFARVLEDRSKLASSSTGVEAC